MKHFNAKKAEREFDIYNFPFRLICCGQGSLESDYEIVLNYDSVLWCISIAKWRNGYYLFSSSNGLDRTSIP